MIVPHRVVLILFEPLINSFKQSACIFSVQKTIRNLITKLAVRSIVPGLSVVLSEYLGLFVRVVLFNKQTGRSMGPIWGDQTMQIYGNFGGISLTLHCLGW